MKNHILIKKLGLPLNREINYDPEILKEVFHLDDYTHSVIENYQMKNAKTFHLYILWYVEEFLRSIQ